MKSHLKLISTKGMSYQDWLAHRQMGIGGSEIQYIMGLNNPKYGSNLELHLKKSGIWDKEQEDNFHMYKGRATENTIINEYWKYYTDSRESVLINSADPNFVKKKCRKVNAFIINPKYPWLFASIDRELPIGHISRLTGEPLEDGGVLEAKNTQNAEASHYEANIAPNFLAQTQDYLAITERKYAELQILIDSTYPELYAFNRSETFIEGMLDITKAFWDNVLKSRELVKIKKEAEARGDYSGHSQIEYELIKLEPPVQSGEGYNQFLKEKYRDRESGMTILGSDEYYQLAIELKKTSIEIKELEKKESFQENTIKKYMFDNGIERLEFEDKQYVSLKKDVNGTFRFKNNIKL